MRLFRLRWVCSLRLVGRFVSALNRKRCITCAQGRRQDPRGVLYWYANERVAHPQHAPRTDSNLPDLHHVGDALFGTGVPCTAVRCSKMRLPVRHSGWPLHDTQSGTRAQHDGDTRVLFAEGADDESGAMDRSLLWRPFIYCTCRTALPSRRAILRAFHAHASWKRQHAGPAREK